MEMASRELPMGSGLKSHCCWIWGMVENTSTTTACFSERTSDYESNQREIKARTRWSRFRHWVLYIRRWLCGSRWGYELGCGGNTRGGNWRGIRRRRYKSRLWEQYKWHIFPFPYPQKRRRVLPYTRRGSKRHTKRTEFFEAKINKFIGRFSCFNCQWRWARNEGSDKQYLSPPKTQEANTNPSVDPRKKWNGILKDSDSEISLQSPSRRFLRNKTSKKSKAQAKADPDSSDSDVVLTLERRKTPRKWARYAESTDSEIILTSPIKGKGRKKQTKGKGKGKGVKAWLTGTGGATQMAWRIGILRSNGKSSNKLSGMNDLDIVGGDQVVGRGVNCEYHSERSNIS